MIKEKLLKVLSRNDTGETNSHQSGIRIPYDVARSIIFPQLSSSILNPRVEVDFYDAKNIRYVFQFIYYNDQLFGKKPRGHNEYRLTCVKAFLKDNNAKSGDEIWFSIDDTGIRRVGIIKATDSDTFDFDKGIVITDKSGWKTIKF